MMQRLFKFIPPLNDHRPRERGRIGITDLRDQAMHHVLRRGHQHLHDRIHRRGRQLGLAQVETHLATRLGVQPALELQGDPLPPGQGRVGIHRTQGVVGNGQRLGEAHHMPILTHDRHVIRQERAGIVVHRPQDGGGLARVRPGGHQHRLPIEGNAGRMHQGIALAHKTPAQDRLDHIRVEHVQRILQDRRDRHFHLIFVGDRDLEAITAQRFPIMNVIGA